MAFFRTVLGAAFVSVVLSNPIVLSFVTGAVAGVYIGQNYEVPNIEANARK